MKTQCQAPSGRIGEWTASGADQTATSATQSSANETSPATMPMRLVTAGGLPGPGSEHRGGQDERIDGSVRRRREKETDRIWVRPIRPDEEDETGEEPDCGCEPRWSPIA